MSEYWMGVLSIPALIAALAVGWLAVKAIGLVGERLLVTGTLRLTRDTPHARRAAVSGVIFSAKRAWMVAPGDIGLALIVGMDNQGAAEAARKLQREPRRIKVNPSPRPKDDPEVPIA